MIQSVSQLNNKVEIGDIKDKQNEEEVDDKTERTIKNLRITPATPSEQQTELLRFIARKESKVLELREELKRQEEELRLLKNQWKTIVSNEKSIKPNDDVMVNGTTETIGDEGIKFIGRGFNSVIGGINKVKDEATLEKISQIKTAVSEVANSTPVKKTRKKTVDFTSQAWSNISKGFSSLVESKAIKTAKRKTLETVHTVERTINEALVPQSLYAQCPTVSSTPATSPKLSNSTVTSSFSTTESFDSTDVTFKTFNESHDNNNDSNGIITKEIISSPNITTTTITNGSPTSSASIISFTTLTPSPTSLNFPTNNTSYTAINTNNNNNNNTIIFDNKPLDTNVSSSNFAITSDVSDVEDEDDGPSSYFLDDKDS